MPGISQWRKKRQTVRSHGVYVYHKRRMQVTSGYHSLVYCGCHEFGSTVEHKLLSKGLN